jgi:hypothetical protein
MADLLELLQSIVRYPGREVRANEEAIGYNLHDLCTEPVFNA